MGKNLKFYEKVKKTEEEEEEEKRREKKEKIFLFSFFQYHFFLSMEGKKRGKNIIFNLLIC